MYIVSNERFKEIDYDGAKIIVSDHGRVFWRGKERNQNTNHDGYKVVSIETNKGWRNPSVHRLVALAFIKNDDPENKLEVNHIDYDRTNNIYTNLEWCTHKENVMHSAKVGKYSRYGEDNPNYGNRMLSQYYALHPDVAKNKQGRPGKQNGRCRSTDLYYNGQLIKTFDYFEQCVEYVANELSKSLSYVRHRLHNDMKSNSTYHGYAIVKH